MYDFDSEVIIISSTIEGSADFNKNMKKTQIVKTHLSKRHFPI